MRILNVLVLADFDNQLFRQLEALGANIHRHLAEDLSEIEVLIVRSKTQVNQSLVEHMPLLKCVITATHGKDHIDEEYLLAKEIDLYTVPVQFHDVAQGVIAYILAFSTNLVEANRYMKQFEWKKKELIGFRIQAKSLGIIGYGRIGREVARLASQLGMAVVIYDPFIIPQTFHNITMARTLQELLDISDIVTIHVPLTDETRDMLGEHELRLMKPNAYLINTARGGIVNEEALLNILNEGRLRGVGLDVFQFQHPWYNEVSTELVKHSRVIATPHSVGQTREALLEKGETIIAIIRRYLKRTRASVSC
jgi:D-3-phosphoglycerate dehydrogenase